MGKRPWDSLSTGIHLEWEESKVECVHVRVCVCVCKREAEGERETDINRDTQR